MQRSFLPWFGHTPQFCSVTSPYVMLLLTKLWTGLQSLDIGSFRAWRGLSPPFNFNARRFYALLHVPQQSRRANLPHRAFGIPHGP